MTQSLPAIYRRPKPILSKPLRGYLLLLLLLVCATTSSYAAHFRFGLMTATRLSETTTSVTYRLNVSTSWRIGTNGGPSNRYNFSGGNSGFTDIPMAYVTDPSGGWINGSGTKDITLNKTTTPTRISWTSGNKISTLRNNADGRWDVYLVLNTANPGSGPVSSLPAVINMPVNATAATYTIPVSDPDPGSTFTFGVPNFSSGPLAGQSNPSGFSLNSSTGQITLNTVGKVVGQLYNAMVTVTDNHGNQIMLDFIIQMVGASNPPQFDYSANATPPSNTVINVIAGQNISFPIKATDPDAGSTVRLSVSGLPAYITTSNFSPALPAAGNPAQTTFSWTPTSAQVGTTNVLNLIATDNVGVQTTTSVTLKVVAEPAPVFSGSTPGEGSVRPVVPGVEHQDIITAESSLGSAVSIAFATIPSGATLSPTIPTPAAHPATTTLSWTPTTAQWGSHSLSYQATIASQPTIFATRAYELIVNTPPKFTSIPPASSVIAGQPYSYSVIVSDPDTKFGDKLTIASKNPLPAWLTLTDNGDGTATLSGTPTVADAGEVHIHLEAEDFYHIHEHQDVTIEVVPCNITLSASKTDVSCPSATDGAIDLTVNGGTAPFTFSWTNSTATTKDLTNLAAGNYTVIVKDANDCEATTMVEVGTIPDVMAPTLSGPAPQDVVVSCSDVPAPATVAAADNCDNAPAVTLDEQSTQTANGTGLYNYTITRTWTAKDASGNSAVIATQIVTVEDKTAPVADVAELPTLNGECSVTVASAPTATDNCVGNVTATTADPLSYSQQGTYTITWTYSDGNGNSSQQTQTVVVKDVTAPVITSNGDMNVLTDKDLCGASVVVSASATDNCSVGSPSGIRNDGKALTDLFPVGTTTITWNVTDANGNQATQVSQTVAVTDNQAPVAMAKPIVVQLDAAGKASIQASDVDNGSNDACGIASLSLDKATFDCASVGDNTVTLTVTDKNGNQSTATATVTVRDEVKPTAIARNLTVTLRNGIATVTAQEVNENSSDACGIQSLALSKTSFDCNEIGKHTVTLTVTDKNGNVSTASATISVIGVIPSVSIAVTPSSNVKTGADTKTIFLGYGSQSVTMTATNSTSAANASTFSWSPATALSSATAANPVFAPTQAGQYSFTVKATNEYGCTATAAETITVIDVRCGNKNDKVLVCHKTNSAKNPWNQICIDANAVAAHLEKGSKLGTCASNPGARTSAEDLGSTNPEVTELTVVVGPNPTRDMLRVDIKLPQPVEVLLEVRDLRGMLFQSRQLAPQGTSLNEKVSLADYPEGVYLLNVQTATERRVIKVMRVQ